MKIELTRRRFLASSLLLASFGSRATNRTQAPRSPQNPDVEYGQATLPRGIRSRRIDTNNHVVLHTLEAGFETPGRPCVLLLHGFPELAYIWRHQMLPLARAGFHVIAPDVRGYGLSAQKPVAWDDSLVPYSMLNRVSDVLGLVRALGHEKVALVVGHDWSGPTAQWCARLRPDVFQSVVSVSTPFLYAPKLPLDSAAHPASGTEDDMDQALAALPRPRKHYATYSATRAANEDMWHPPQGIHNLLRQMFYFKSADWDGNQPFPLKSWTASELAKMPTYYIMDLNKGIAATMAEHEPTLSYIAGCQWMTEADLEVFTSQFSRTGFQGGFNYYRVAADPALSDELNSFEGKTIDVPACYIAGGQEWGAYQSPGAFQTMDKKCTQLKGTHFVPHAGHSVVEEQPDAVNKILLDFVRQV